MMNRSRDICGGVERDGIGYPFGEIAADFLHGLLYGIGHVDGVGTGKHVDVEHGGIQAVDTAFSGIG